MIGIEHDIQNIERLNFASSINQTRFTELDHISIHSLTEFHLHDRKVYTSYTDQKKHIK